MYSVDSLILNMMGGRIGIFGEDIKLWYSKLKMVACEVERLPDLGFYFIKQDTDHVLKLIFIAKTEFQSKFFIFFMNHFQM